MAFVKENEQEFIQAANEHGDRQTQLELGVSRKELEKAKARLAQLDTIFRKMYEDNVMGKLSDSQFAALAIDFEGEKNTLTAQTAKLEQTLRYVTLICENP